VRKRDGREVPFDARKIEAAVQAALDAVGEADPHYAGEVAGLVELALGARDPEGRPGGEGSAHPGIEEIQDLVERALIEMGLAEAAKSYILYRDRRARVRGALRVEKGGAPRGASPRLRVSESGRSAPWSKGRIAAALMSEADLPRETAEEVAARVEERVFETGLERIGTGLIRELVDNELVGMGLTAAMRRQGPVGVPRHDLRRIVAGVPLRAWEGDARRAGLDARPASAPRAGVEGAVAGEVMRRFALEDLLDDGVADLHLAGDLHVEDLERPHLPLWLALPSAVLAPGDGSARAASAALEEVARLLPTVARGIVIEDPGPLLHPLARAARPGSPVGLAAHLRALAALARAAGKRVDLGSPGPRMRALTLRLVEELAELEPELAAPRLFLDAEEILDLVDAGASETVIDRLLSGGRLVPVWSGPSETFAAPGARRLVGERGALAVGGAVALNLPRAAREVGPWREDALLPLLSDLVRAALTASRTLERFQQEAAGPDARGGAHGMRARTGFALVPAGLREALRVLGGGTIDPEQGARLVGFLDEASRRFAGDGGPQLVLDPFGGDRARALRRARRGPRRGRVARAGRALRERPRGRGPGALRSGPAPGALRRLVAG
jgi:hypothetical protein